MLLKSVKYHNFRPFIGDQEIQLASDNKDSNVTIILGDNTFGKSTFVLSFIWCLYGKNLFAKPDILNNKVEKSLSVGQKETAFVEIMFEDDNIPYTMRRTQVFTKAPNGMLTADESVAKLTYTDVDGQEKGKGKLQNEINEVIKSILPYDLSEFFFFEGEKKNDITKRSLQKAVKTLLGLAAFDEMRTHLYGDHKNKAPAATSVMGIYLDKQTDDSDKEVRKYKEEIANAEQTLSNNSKRLIEIDEQYEKFQKVIEDNDEKLRQAAPSKELQARRERIEKDIKTLENDLKSENKKFILMFSKNSIPLFVSPLIKKSSERLNAMDVEDKGIKGIEATAIRELLKRGYCLCGTDLKEGTLAHKNVEKYIDYIPPKSVGTLVSDMYEAIAENGEKCNDFLQNFNTSYARIQNLKHRINELHIEERDVIAEIGKVGKIDTTEIENSNKFARKTQQDLSEEKGIIRNQNETCQTTIETNRNRLNQVALKSEEAKKYRVYYKYAEAIYKWVNENYIEKETNMRSKLKAYVTELFNNMYSGERDIDIDEQYNISMTYKGQTIDGTGGLNVILYFSYVAGLVKLAYEVMQERTNDEEGNEQVMGEQYPLVLDAAFSHADETHTKNIARELSTSVNQLVLALMKKDWEHAKAGLSGKVSKIYELIKVDETEVRIKVVE